MALMWETLTIDNDGGMMSYKVVWAKRAKVPGGWLVAIESSGTGLTFYPDPAHQWDGSSLP